MRQWEKIYLTITTGITIAGLLLIGVWTFYPTKVITIENSQAVRVDKEVYNAGDRLTYTIDYCKYGNYPATVSRALVNSIRINFTSYYNNLGAGCGTVSNADLVIPDFVSSGTYRIETTIEYKLNPLKTVMVNWRTVDFQVTNLSNDATQLINHEQQDNQRFDQLFKNRR